MSSNIDFDKDYSRVADEYAKLTQQFGYIRGQVYMVSQDPRLLEKSTEGGVLEVIQGGLDAFKNWFGQQPEKPKQKDNRKLYQIEIGETWTKEWENKIKGFEKQADEHQKKLKELLPQLSSKEELRKDFLTTEAEKKLRKDFLITEAEFERAIFQSAVFRIHIISEVIKKLEGNKDEEVKNTIEVLRSEYEVLRKQMLEIKKHMKEIKTQLIPFMEEKPAQEGMDFAMASFQLDTYTAMAIAVKEDIKLPETWDLNDWAQILTEGLGLKDAVSKGLGSDFKSSVDALKREIRTIKEKKKQSEEDTKKLNELRRTLYQIYLQRSIDVIGVLKRSLKDKEKPLLPSEKQMIEGKIKVLGEFYKNKLVKYEVVCAQIKDPSLLEAVWNSLKSTVSLGYLSEEYISPNEFERRKHYADLGYVMTEDVKLWLTHLKIDPSKGEFDWKDVIKREVKNFWEWAENHPKAAEELVGDIRLTVDLLQEKDFLTTFDHNMQSRALTSAFLGQMKITGSDDPVDTEEQLKYRALADLCKYLPVATAVSKTVADRITVGNLSITGALVETARNALRAKAIQTASKSIGSEYTNLAMTVAQVIRGDDFQRIMARRTELEMVRMGGLAKEVLLHPKSAAQYIKRETTIWWKSLFRARNWKERLARVTVQVILPVGSVIAAGGVVAAAAFLGVITFGAAIPIAIGILSIGFAGYRALYRGVNSIWSGTRLGIENELHKDFLQKNVDRLKKDEEIRGQITKRRVSFIEELKKRFLLPNLKPIKLNLSEREKKTVKGVTDDLSKEIARENLNREKWIKDIHSKIQDLEQKMKQLIEQKEKDNTVLEIQKLKKKIENIKKDDLMSLVEQFTDSLNISDIAIEAEKRIVGNVSEENKKSIAEKIARDVVNNLIETWLSPQLDEAFYRETAKLYSTYYGKVDRFINKEVDNDIKGYVEGDSENVTNFIEKKIRAGTGKSVEIVEQNLEFK